MFLSDMQGEINMNNQPNEEMNYNHSSNILRKILEKIATK